MKSASLVHALGMLLKSADRLMQEREPEPRRDSPRHRESGEVGEDPSRVREVMFVCGLAENLIDTSGDHLKEVVQILRRPVATLTAVTCTRAALESSAFAAWLMDPQISVDERLTRRRDFWAKGLEQKRKCGIGGSERKAGEKHKEIRATDIVKAALGMEKEYRTYSACLHGNTWALSHLCYTEFIFGGIHGLAKGLKPDARSKLCISSAKALGTAVTRYLAYLGHNAEEIAAIIGLPFRKEGVVLNLA